MMATNLCESQDILETIPHNVQIVEVCPTHFDFVFYRDLWINETINDIRCWIGTLYDRLLKNKSVVAQEFEYGGNSDPPLEILTFYCNKVQSAPWVKRFKNRHWFVDYLHESGCDRWNAALKDIDLLMQRLSSCQWECKPSLADLTHFYKNKDVTLLYDLSNGLVDNEDLANSIANNSGSYIVVAHPSDYFLESVKDKTWKQIGETWHKPN